MDNLGSGLIVTNESVEEIKQWCEEKKASSDISPILVQNPFKEKFAWTSSIINIEIDREIRYANKRSLVYDSVTKKLYRHMGISWVEVFPAIGK